MYLKVMHSTDLSPVDSDNPHSIYGDVTSCSFLRHPPTSVGGKGSATARIYIREPIKTAMVAGFEENEKLIELRGPAYLMNDNGKTVSVFTPLRSGERAREESEDIAPT